MDDENDDVGVGSSPLAIIANMGQSYTTPEAHTIAKQIYDRYESTRDSSYETQNKYADQAEAAALQARDVLKAARERLQSKKYNNALQLLAISKGLGQGTRSGAFSESISNAADALAEPTKERMKWEEGREAGVTDLDLKMTDIDRGLAEARMGMATHRTEAEQKMAMEALKLLGKEIRPTSASSGNRNSSPFGKIAADEGFLPGTLPFAKRVRQLYNTDLHQRQQAAGLDVNEEDPESHQKLVNDFGVPMLARDPFVGLSTKDKQRALEARKKEAEDTLKESNTATTTARQSIQDMDQFVALNKNNPTGPIIGRIWPGLLLSSDGQTMGAITARQSRQMRVPGEGPMSNYDARQLQMAAVSPTKRPETNATIAAGVKAVKQTQLEFNKYLHDYYAAYGHISGAEDSWLQYVDANPVFDPKAPGKFRLNKERLPYQEFFRAQNAAIGKGPVAAAAPPTADDDIGLPDDDPNVAPDGTPITDYDRMPARAPRSRGPTGRAQGGYLTFAEGGQVRRASGGPTTRKHQKDTGLQQLLRNMAQGASFNFSDEALAAASGEPYETAIADQRRPIQESSSEDPMLTIGEQALGTIPVAAGSAYLARKGLSRMKGKAGKAALLTKLIPKNIYAKLALTGGLTGAAAGAGTSQDDSMLSDTLSGGAVGTVLGPLGGLLTKYGLRGGQRLYDAVRGKGMPAADRKVVEAAIKDNVNLRDSAAQMASDARKGIPTTLVDTGGRNMEGLATSIAKRGGEGPDEMLDILEGRQMGAGERVGDRVNKSLMPDDYLSKKEQLKELLYTQAKPLYEKAYAENPAVDSQALWKMMGTKIGKQATDRAMAQMEALGEPIGPVDALGNVMKPSLQFMDRTKRALDGMINETERGGATDQGHVLRTLRSRLMSDLEDPNVVKGTAYKDARKQYAGDLEVLDALELGRNKFHSLNPNELTALTQNMSYAEKDALRTGVAEHLFTKLANTADSQNPAQKVIGTPGVRDKLRLLFDSDAKYNEFEGALRKEASMFDRGKRTVAAGRSARVAQGDENPSSARDILMSAGMSTLAPGSDLLAQPGWFARAGTALSRAFNPMSQGTIDDTARILSTQDPRTAIRPLDSLQVAMERLKKQLSRASDSALGGAATTGASVGPDPYGYSSDDADDGYASGGPVVGMSDPRLSPLVAGPDAAPPAVPTGSKLMGTGAMRSRLAMPTGDLSHYGEDGGEYSHFLNNTAPDPYYVSKPQAVATGTGNTAGSGNGASTAGGIATLLAGLKDTPKLVDAYKTITGSNPMGSIKNFLSGSPTVPDYFSAPDLTGLGEISPDVAPAINAGLEEAGESGLASTAAPAASSAFGSYMSSLGSSALQAAPVMAAAWAAMPYFNKLVGNDDYYTLNDGVQATPDSQYASEGWGTRVQQPDNPFSALFSSDKGYGMGLNGTKYTDTGGKTWDVPLLDIRSAPRPGRIYDYLKKQGAVLPSLDDFSKQFYGSYDTVTKH